MIIHPEQWALIAATVATVSYAWRLPHAVQWISLGILSFVSSTAWARYGFPWPPLFGLCTDFAVWIVIYHYAQKRWELAFAWMFLGMIAVDLVALGGMVFNVPLLSNWWRVLLLELLNYGALGVIAATARTQEVGSGISRGRRSGSLDFVRRALHRQRSHPPFTRVP